MQRNTNVEMRWLDDLDLPEGDSDLIRETRRRHAQSDAIDVEALLAGWAGDSRDMSATKKAKGKHE